MIRRSPSLFITFAVAFFALLLIATLLQWWFFSDLIDPLIVSWERNRIELATAEAGRELQERLDELDDAGIEELLTRHGESFEGLIVVYVRERGDLLSNHPLHPRMEQALAEGLGHFRQGDREQPRHFRPPFPDGPGREGKREVHGRIDILKDDDLDGQLISILPPGLALQSTSRHNPRLLLLFLPLALLLAGLAGLIVFRVLTRRLQALEDQASRISRGDLQGRIGDLGRDEIGRLGERFDAMTVNLARAREIISANDRQRRQLLADISHDLATPLTSIRGFTETLQNSDLSLSATEQARYLGHVGEEARRMALLIDDLLELSRLEAGSIPLQKEKLDLASLCKNILERYAERFTAAELTLTGDGLSSAQWIDADGRRMEQVVENLLSNALRYVPAGESVGISVTGDLPDKVILRIWDSGPGFAEPDLPHVFDRFYRADGARSGEGSGLGLAIVKEIVFQHGGEISASNRSDGGAVIELVFGRAIASN